MQEKQLQLSRRDGFFKDPFFADLQGGMRDGLERQLAEFSARSMGVAGAGLNEAAHNIQVSASNDKFQIQLELPGFAPEDFALKTKDDIIIVEAVHEAMNEDGSTDSRKFSKEFKMPAGVVTERLASTYSGAGILTVSAPRTIQAPEGAEVRLQASRVPSHRQRRVFLCQLFPRSNADCLSELWWNLGICPPTPPAHRTPPR